MKRFTQLNREYKELQKIVEVYFVYKNLVENIANAREIMNTEKDAEMRDMAKQISSDNRYHSIISKIEAMVNDYHNKTFNYIREDFQ